MRHETAYAYPTATLHLVTLNIKRLIGCTTTDEWEYCKQMTAIWEKVWPLGADLWCIQWDIMENMVSKTWDTKQQLMHYLWLKKADNLSNASEEINSNFCLDLRPVHTMTHNIKITIRMYKHPHQRMITFS